MSLAVNTIPTPYIHVVVKRRKNTWYTVKDGNWSDPLVWESNAIRRWNYPGQNIPSPVFPQVGDDVYIGHTVTLDTGSFAAPLTVNNLYVAGALKSNNSIYLNVNGDLQSTGSVDFTSSDINLTLFGANNYIVNFTRGNSTIIYSRNGDQNVMAILYNNLTIANSFGTKYLAGDTTVNANVNIIGGGTFDAYLYNFTVTGSTAVGGTFLKSGSGSLLFTGNLNSNRGLVDLSGGNPSIEFRGGYTSTFSLVPNFGTGTMNFTTNNQTFACVNANIILNNSSVTITGAITLTLTGNIVPSVTTGYLQINTSINGTVAGSTLLNKGNLFFGTSAAAASPMSTGVFDYTSNSNLIGYVFAGNYTLPYSNYYSLYVSGGDTKTMSSSLNLLGNLYTGGGTTLDISTFDLTVNGSTQNVGTLYKVFSGNTILIGQYTTTATNTGTINFDSALTVEMRGGISASFGTTFSGNFTLNFTTNNQSITIPGATINCNILISGAITIIHSASIADTTTGTINGDNVASIFDNRGLLHYQNATAPMVTGLLYCNQATNTWFYDLAGNQDIQPPNDPTTPGYKNLTLAGSGAKRLLGNVSVKGTYTLTSPATLDLNGFSLTNP